jgi:Cdc6-like AAA superfamily ATPase
LHREENERDYGQETIEILLQVMENQRDDLVVILAGYKDRMTKFFECNPGFSSRIAHHIDFPDYTDEELFEIAELMLHGMHYRPDADAKVALREYIERRKTQPNFANARSIRNALDRARLRQANRVFSSKDAVTRDALETIMAADIRASRVFGNAQ